MLTITPLDGADDTWFTVPEPQRPVGPGASVVYPVGVAVPPATAQGTYGLQGVAYSADRPCESSATSKRVSLTVGPPAAGKGVPTWVWLVVAAAGLLVVGVVAFLLTRGGGEDDADAEPPGDAPASLATAPPAISGGARAGPHAQRRPRRVVGGPGRRRLPVGALRRHRRGVRADRRRPPWSTPWSPATSITACRSR